LAAGFRPDPLSAPPYSLAVAAGEDVEIKEEGKLERTGKGKAR